MCTFVNNVIRQLPVSGTLTHYEIVEMLQFVIFSLGGPAGFSRSEYKCDSLQKEF